MFKIVARSIVIPIFLFHTQLALSQSQPRENLIQSVFQVYNYNGVGFTTGSAVLLDDRRTIVTAYHVIQGARKLTFTSTNAAISDPTLEAFDSQFDIAIFDAGRVLAATGIGRKKSDGETRSAGTVIGNPDGKRNFSIPVSLPIKGKLNAQKWIFPKGTNLTFTSSALELIPVNGTINRGMSGAPLIVGDELVGIISGSEEYSGGGLGWAIPIDVVDLIQKNGRKIRPADLPPSDILTGSAKLMPLRATLSSSASRYFSGALELERLNTESRRRWKQAGQALFDACASSKPVDRDPQSIQNCLNAVSSEAIPALQSFNQINAELARTIDPISSKIEEDFAARLQPRNFSNGTIREFLAGADCLAAASKQSAALLTSNKNFATWATQVPARINALFSGLPNEPKDFSPVELENFKQRISKDDPLNDIGTYFISGEGNLAFNRLISLTASIEACLRQFANALDSDTTRTFSSNASSSSVSLSWADYSPRERHALAGLFFGYKAFLEIRTDFCQNRGIDSPLIRLEMRDGEANRIIRSYIGADSSFGMDPGMLASARRGISKVSDARTFCQEIVGYNYLQEEITRAVLGGEAKPTDLRDQIIREAGIFWAARTVKEPSSLEFFGTELNIAKNAIAALIASAFAESEGQYCIEVAPSRAAEIESALRKYRTSNQSVAAARSINRMGLGEEATKSLTDKAYASAAEFRKSNVKMQSDADKYCAKLAIQIPKITGDLLFSKE